MSKGVNLPTNSWSHIKFLFNKPMPKSRLINHINVMRCCLIMHTHPPISEATKKDKSINTKRKWREKEHLRLHYMNSNWPELTSCLTILWTASLWSLHQRWKNACIDYQGRSYRGYEVVPIPNQVPIVNHHAMHGIWERRRYVSVRWVRCAWGWQWHKSTVYLVNGKEIEHGINESGRIGREVQLQITNYNLQFTSRSRK